MAHGEKRGVLKNPQRLQANFGGEYSGVYERYSMKNVKEKIMAGKSAAMFIKKFLEDGDSGRKTSASEMVEFKKACAPGEFTKMGDDAVSTLKRPKANTSNVTPS